MDMSLCLEASDVCAVNEGDCGWVWEWRAGHFGMCSSWPRKWPGGLCLLLESLWTWALPTSLRKLRPKSLSNAEFSTDKLEWSLLNSADGVIVWDVESDLQLFLFRDVDCSKVFIDFFFFFLGGRHVGSIPQPLYWKVKSSPLGHQGIRCLQLGSYILSASWSDWVTWQ